MTLWLRLHTSNTELVKLLYISTETGPGISTADEFQYFVLTKVSNKNIVMTILGNACMEMTSRWYINSVIKKEKTIGVHRPLAICGDVFCNN